MVTNLEQSKQITLKSKAAEQTWFVLNYSTWTKPEQHRNAYWRGLQRRCTNESVTGSFSLKAFGFFCAFWARVPPHSSLLVIVRSHSSVIAVCVYLRCLPSRSSVTRARSFAMFSFSATSPGWTPQRSKGSTGCGSKHSLDMQSWIYNNDSRTNVFCSSLNAGTHDYPDTHFRGGFYPPCIDAVPHVNRRLPVAQLSRAADHWQANREEGDHNSIWRLLICDTHKHTTQDMKVSRRTYQSTYVTLYKDQRVESVDLDKL